MWVIKLYQTGSLTHSKGTWKFLRNETSTKDCGFFDGLCKHHQNGLKPQSKKNAVKLQETWGFHRWLDDQSWISIEQDADKSPQKKKNIYTSYNCIYHPKNKTLCCKEKITNSSAYTILNVQTLTFILTIPLQAFEPNMKPIYHLEEPPRKIRKRFHLSPRTSGVKRRPTEPNMASKLDIFRIPWCLEWFSFWSLMMCMVMYDDMYVYFLKYMCIYIYRDNLYYNHL